MRRPSSKNFAAILSTILTLAIGIACWKIAQKVSSDREWSVQRTAIDNVLAGLQPTQPTSIHAEKWKQAVISLQEGFWNGCFSPETVTTDELIGLESRIRAIIDGRQIDYETLVDILIAIGETNAAANKYTNAYLPCFHGILRSLGYQHLPKEK